MDRLFLDANVLFSAADQTGCATPPTLEAEDVALCSSRYALRKQELIYLMRINERDWRN